MPLKSPLHQLFCHNLRDRRLAAGLTQMEMAKRMGIAQGNYSDLENGRSAPTLPTIEKAATALGLLAQDLLSAKKLQTAS